MYCKKCHYPLLRLKSRQCPECGRVFNPSRRQTFDQYPWSLWTERRRNLGVFISVVAATLSVLLVLWGGTSLINWFYGEGTGTRSGWGSRFFVPRAEKEFALGVFFLGLAGVGLFLSLGSARFAISRCAVICCGIWCLGWYLAVHYGYLLFPM